MMPLLMCLYVPNLTAISSRFLIQTIVDDKQTKMRETLRIMSLSQLSYAFSFFIFQGIFAIIGGFIFGAFVINDNNLFPQDAMNSSLLFMAVIILHNISTIPFAMSLSTFFDDSKVAAYMGQLFLILPMILFITLVQNESKWIYAFYFIPLFPACSILVYLTTPRNLAITLIFDPSYISMPASWGMLVVSTPLWILAYLYLDSVLPSEYGIQKHPLFCLRSRGNQQEDFEPEDDMEKKDAHIYNP